MIVSLTLSCRRIKDSIVRSQPTLLAAKSLGRPACRAGICCLALINVHLPVVVCIPGTNRCSNSAASAPSVHNLPDRPQRMIQWHPRFAVHIAEQRFAPHILPAISALFRNPLMAKSGRPHSAAYGLFLCPMTSGCTLVGGSCCTGNERALPRNT